MTYNAGSVDSQDKIFFLRCSPRHGRFRWESLSSSFSRGYGFL